MKEDYVLRNSKRNPNIKSSTLLRNEWQFFTTMFKDTVQIFFGQITLQHPPTYSKEVSRFELVNGTYKIKPFDKEVASEKFAANCIKDDFEGQELDKARKI